VAALSVSVLGLLVPVSRAAAAVSAGDYAALVDPFVSTAGDDGNDLPGAQAPNGLAKVNPLTVPNRNHAGYDYNEDHIAGFTQDNLDGVGGSGAAGDILVVPTSVSYAARPSTGSYEHPYSHDDEDAEPGYYRVGLGAIQGADGAVVAGSGTIDAEVTATTRTALHRYAFPDGATPSLVVDLRNNFTSRTDSSLGVQVLEDGRVAIAGDISGSFNNASYAMHYYAETVQPVATVRTWGPDGALTDATAQRGADTGAVLTFAPEAGGDVELRITLSTISADQARIDQVAELAGLDFDGVRAQTRAAWNDRLGRVDVTASLASDPDGDLKKLFYTHLYRMFALPMNATSTSGTYRGVDGAVHRAEGFTYYDSWSSWDDFRKYSVLAYVDPTLYRDEVQSLIVLFADAHQAGGSLGSLTHGVPTVRWERSAVIIADALSKGFTGFDRLDDAYPALRSYVGDYTGKQLRLGYIENDPGSSVQRGYDQWALAIIADALGRSDEAAQLREQAAFPLANLIKPGAWQAADGTPVGLLTPRDANGAWVAADYERFEDARLYQGTLWQYTWYDAYDMDGLLAAMGGDEAGRLAIEHLFGEDGPDDGSGMLHSNANEIDLQAPYLFNYVGEPSLTQKWVRAIYTKETWNRYIATGSTGEAPTSGGEFRPPVKTRVYKLAPDGFLPTMDNDAGTMSTMFVAAALGLFPVTAGSSQYQIGTPFFDAATIRYDTGRSFTVTADGVTPDAFYIQSAELNGASLGNTWLDYSQIVAGGELDFRMGEEPSDWGADTEPAYSLSTAGEGAPAAPAYPVTAEPTTVEAAADGAVDGAVTLALGGGARFAAPSGTSLTGSGAATVRGLPDSVAADVVVTGETTAEVRLTGSTTGSARFSLVFADAAFADGVRAAQVDGTGLSDRAALTLSTAPAERVELQRLVDEASLVRPGSYSYASYQAFQGVLGRARVTLADPAATSAELRAAAESLQSAIAALALDEGAYRLLQAEASDTWSGGSLKNETYLSGGNLGGVAEGAWVQYRGLDFAGVTPQSIAVRYSSKYASTGQPSSVEVRAGDADGPVVATVSLPGTNDWANYTTVEAAITDPAALMAARQATLVFHSPAGQEWVSNFDWFQFSVTPPGGGEQEPLVLDATNTTATGDGALPLNLSRGLFENVSNGAWAEWADRDLGDGVDRVTVAYDKPQSRAASDSHIELRLGSRTGALLADIPLAYTGSGWGTTGTATADLDPVVLSGTQTIYALFLSTTQTDAQPYVANVTSLELRPAEPSSGAVIEAEDWVANSGGGLKSESNSWDDGTSVVNLGGTYDGAWLDYGVIDFGAEPAAQVSVHYVNNSARCGLDSAIDVYLDDFDASDPGAPFASIPLPVTGAGWANAGTTTASLPTGITGEHRVVLVLRTVASDGHTYVANIDSLTFAGGPLPVDLSGLEAAIAEAAPFEADAARYDAVDVAVLLRELQAARALLAAGDATQAQADAQARSLRLAAGQLVPRARLLLEALLEQARGVDDARYTEASWGAFRSALDAAESVAGDAAATDAALDAARTALDQALDALETRPEAVPVAPAAVSIGSERTSVIVHWAAPADDGGSPVIGYLVELDDADHAVRIDDPTQTSAVFALLPAGATLRARVSAINAVGTSAPSAYTAAVAVSAPGALAAAERAASTGAPAGLSAADASADYEPGPFPSDVLSARYASDSWPATPDGSNPFLHLLRGVSELGSDVLAPNQPLAEGQTPTAFNDTKAIEINHAASLEQIDRAEYDADNGANVTMADGLGSRLGDLYLAALRGGELPKTDALFGRTTSGLDNVDAAKNFYAYKRPYVRMGFTGSGGLVDRSDNGSYDGLAGSGSLPSGHTYGGYTAGTLLATLLPELAPQILARTSEYGDNRIVLGFHYPLDVMGGRMVAQATIAHRWADPEFADLLLQAHEEIESVLLAECQELGYGDSLEECAGDPYRGLVDDAAVQVYSGRLTYGFPQIGEAGQPLEVPADAPALLLTAFPDLTDAQRAQIIAQTAVDSGYPLDLTADGDESWERVDLARALTAEVTVNPDGSVTVENYRDETRASVSSAGSISVDGVELDGFSADTRTYVVDWPADQPLPEVTVTPSEAGASVHDGVGAGLRALSVAPALALAAAAPLQSTTYAVVSENGSRATRYTVAFHLTTRAEQPGSDDPGTGVGGGSGSGGSGAVGSGSLSSSGTGSVLPLAVLLLGLGLLSTLLGRRRRRRQLP